MLERATGESFAAYLSTRLWQPLQNSDGFVWLDRPNGHAKPFCCFFATPRDWARVGQMLIHEGKVGDKQVVPAEWIQKNGKTLSSGTHLWSAHLEVKARTDEYPQVNRGSSAAFIADDTFYLDGYHHQRVVHHSLPRPGDCAHWRRAFRLG